MQLVELSPAVRPAAGQDGAVIASIFPDELVISGISVDLQDSTLAAQVSCDTLGGSTVLEAIGYHRWTAAPKSPVIPGIRP